MPWQRRERIILTNSVSWQSCVGWIIQRDMEEKTTTETFQNKDWYVTIWGRVEVLGGGNGDAMINCSRDAACRRPKEGGRGRKEQRFFTDSADYHLTSHSAFCINTLSESTSPSGSWIQSTAAMGNTEMKDTIFVNVDTGENYLLHQMVSV